MSWDLVGAAQQGDMDAFGQLYRLYEPKVRGYFGGRVWDRDVVEDLTSETFAEALRCIGRVRNQGKDVGAWFMALAKNMLWAHINARSTQLEDRVGDLADLPGALLFITTTSEVEADVLDRQLVAELLRLLDQLDPDERTVIDLRFWGRMQRGPIAERVGASVGVVRNRENRGVARLRSLMASADRGE